VAKARHGINVHDQTGFTLIELIVVMIILAVLLVISIPAYLGFKDRAQQRTAAGNVRSTIPSAEAYFVDKGTYVGMSLPALRAIDSGLSGTIQTVTVSPTAYCISAKVGSWWAHVAGPGGSVVSAESADAC
jgi:prepilin-type N-terminal cleavage/methylation domain-containing protein